MKTPPPDFLTRLESLMERATKGPVIARPEYGARNSEDWEIAPDKQGKFGVPSEIARFWNYEDANEANAELYTFLANHAPAIAEVVRGMECIAKQKLPDELHGDMKDGADYEGAYEIIVGIARNALAALNAGKMEDDA